jgi:hypothetical protein
MVFLERWMTSEWVIVALRQLSNSSAISWREQVNFQWDGDEVRFVLDQHAYGWIFILLAQLLIGRFLKKKIFSSETACPNEPKLGS